MIIQSFVQSFNTWFLREHLDHPFFSLETLEYVISLMFLLFFKVNIACCLPITQIESVIFL